MLRSRTLSVCLLTSASLILGACAFAVLGGGRRPSHVRPSGRDRGSRMLIAGVPLYRQWDARWAEQFMKPSRATMRRYGCLVCCVSMLFSHYGIATTPGELNGYLSSNGGYTGSGLLKWGPCARYTSGRARVDYIGGPNGKRLATEVASGNPVIVKVRLSGGAFHWVLVVGYREGDYLVHDPLGEENGPVKLSRFGRMIHAMRIFRRVEI